MKLVRRVLFVAWQDPVTRRIFPVARLLDRQEGVRWEFVYIHGARAAAERGFEYFLGAENLDRVFESDELPPLFQNRLMRASRPDFPEYLRCLGLPADMRDEVPILARSEGRRATDTIELYGLPTYEEARHPADQLAIRVHEPAGGPVGFIPNTLVEDVHALRASGSQVQVFTERVNPHPAPVQLRLLCRLEAEARGDYLPFASPRYEPIPASATRLRIEPRALTV